MTSQELAEKILAIAQDAQKTGGTWQEADRIAYIQDALDTIIMLCKEQLTKSKE